MHDSVETRAQLDAALCGVSGATCIQVIRFRRHTVGSAAGHAMDVVVDELTSSADGADGPNDGRVGRRGKPGEILVAHHAAGELGRFEVHPAGDDFEAHLVPRVLQACIRTGAAFELWVESECVLRKPSSELVRRGGYREGPLHDPSRLDAAGFMVSEDGSNISHEASEPPRLWAAALLVFLGVACLPITCVAMLFSEPREVLLGMLRNSIQGWHRTWKLTLDANHAIVRTSGSGDTTEDRVDLHRTLLATAWPRGWTLGEPGRVLVAIGDFGIQRLPCPAPEPIAELIAARALRGAN